MEMEVDAQPQQDIIKQEKDLFKAAETGDSSTFKALSPETLSKALYLRNEDARSLLHVAASSGHSQVQFPFPFSLIKFLPINAFWTVFKRVFLIPLQLP